MINYRVAYLVSKKLSGEITDLEINELNEALIAIPELHSLIQLLENNWGSSNLPAALEPAEIERIIKKIQIAEVQEHASLPAIALPEPDRPQAHPLGKRWLKYAVASVLAAAIGLWWMFGPVETTIEETPEHINEVTTKAGSKTRIVLPDGTIVWLNGDSKLSYTSIFKMKNREVNLSGEAYFEVVSNKQRPFIIHGEKITITVTGTTFNVRDYPGEAKAEASLISGIVEVSSNKSPDKIYYLRPSEKIVFKEEPLPGLAVKNSTFTGPKNIQLPKVQIQQVQFNQMDNIPVETAWVYNQLLFSNESFREVADKMEKWYGIIIHFDSPNLEKLRFSGKFEKESLSDALEALKYTTPFRYKLSGKEVIIY